MKNSRFQESPQSALPKPASKISFKAGDENKPPIHCLKISEAAADSRDAILRAGFTAATNDRETAMRGLLKTSTIALMLTCMGGNVVAQTANLARCATAEDMFAIRAAAVQQKLMVAALSCRATKPYQQFVSDNRKALIDSDSALLNFFHRLNEKTGTADYHSFKTHLANAAAIQPSRDALKFCADAKTTFEAAAKANSLKTFLAHQTTAEDGSFAPCKVLTASTHEAPRRR